MRTAWIAAAAILAALFAAWSYARREESVPGRAGPAVLRALALFLLLAGLALPALRPGTTGGARPVVLLDVSRSMTLPAGPAATGRSRIDSARAVLRGLDPGPVILFGDEPVPIHRDSALGAAARAGRSRLVPALEAAGLSGAEHVLVVSDGEWEDRGSVRQVATRLGLGIREIRVATPSGRVGLAELDVPSRVRAGDTVRVAARLVASGSATERAPPPEAAPRDTAPPPVGVPDSVRVELRRSDPPVGEATDAGAAVAVAVVAVPAPGRAQPLELAFVPTGPSTGESMWSTYELRLDPGADPLAAADRRRFVLEVTAEPLGGVLISTDPDWEPRFLLPRLERSVLGGATGFLHLGGDRWARMAARPRPVADEEVRRAASGARLLAVQGRPSGFPDWLRREVERHPRRLLFPRGPGQLPGTPLSLAGPLPGEWYATGPLPASPVARYLAGVSLEVLPPLHLLYRSDGAAAGWTPVVGRRNRRGEPRPLFVAGGAGSRRWVAAIGEGYWRWAFRPGEGERAYEGLVTGLIGWLLEDLAPRDLELREPALADVPLRWSVAPGVHDLSLTVRDSAGRERWSARWEEPGPELDGPVLEPGRYTVVARGASENGRFRRERPVELAAPPGELAPWPTGPLLALERAGEEAGPGRSRPRPLWPFAAAALLLCGEWAWRRRIGLR